MQTTTAGHVTAAVLVLSLGMFDAAASTVTKAFSIEASNFRSTNTAAGFTTIAPPEDPVIGIIQLTFDPDVDATGLTLDRMEMTIAGHVYHTGNTLMDVDANTTWYTTAVDEVDIGGSANGGGNFGTAYLAGEDDFLLTLRLDDGDHSVATSSFVYTTSGNWFAPSVIALRPEAVIPVPAAAWLLGSALAAMLGGEAWSRRHHQARHA